MCLFAKSQIIHLNQENNYSTKPKRSYDISLWFQAPNLPLFISILSKLLSLFNLFFFFHHLLRLIIFLLPRIQKFKSKIMFEKRKTNNPIHAFKEKGKTLIWWPMEGSMLGGLWNEFNIWRSMGKHLVWWPMEGSKFGGLGRFQVWWSLECSMFGCLWKEKEKHLFHLFHFSPHKILF